MRRLIAIAAAALTLCGCNRYVGGFDDSYMKYSQMVLMNRSSKDISLVIGNCEWADPMDTVRLEQGNGLWKKTVEKENYYFNSSDMRMQVISEDGRKVWLDDMSYDFRYNPCRGNMLNLNDSRGLYFVYEFTDEKLDTLDAFVERRNRFAGMNSIPPSYVSSSASVKGTSETLVADVFMNAHVRGKISLGTMIYKEAEDVSHIRIAEGCSLEPQHPLRETEEVLLASRLHAYATYCNIDNLRKIGLAHFGCDFAELTGRGDSEMERFSGLVFSNVKQVYAETFTDRELPEDVASFIGNSPEEVAIVDRICYGKMMFLLAEADCSLNLLYNSVEFSYLGKDAFHLDEIDCYLLTLGPDGEFECRKGGKELIKIYCDGLDSQPVMPLSFRMTGDLDGIACLHVQDIDVSAM